MTKLLRLSAGMSMTSLTSLIKYRVHVNCALFTRYSRRVLWLLQKYTDVVFVDEDEEQPEYRKIVDLEWSIDHIIIRDDQGSAC